MVVVFSVTCDTLDTVILSTGVTEVRIPVLPPTLLFTLLMHPVIYCPVEDMESPDQFPCAPAMLVHDAPKLVEAI